MSSVMVKIYEGRSEVDRKALLKITKDELNKPDFPKTVNVLIGETDQVVTVIVIEPLGTEWDWGLEFDAFTVTKRLFESRP